MPSSNPNSKPSRQSAYRRDRYRRSNPATAFSIGVDIDSLSADLDDWQEQLEENVRPAAQAGAEILYHAVLRNVQALGKKTGNLAGSIYQAFSKDNSAQVDGGYDRASYHVSWNARKAPHGHLVEFGHIQKYKVYLGKDGKWYTNKKAPLPAPKQVAAQSFVRRAAAQFAEAHDAMEKRLLEGVA